MIKHIVLIRFASRTSEVERERVLAGLSGLAQIVPELLSHVIGPNISKEGRSAGFSHAFVAEFADAASRDAYLAHPAHEAAAAALVSAADGETGILVVDLAV